MLFSLWALNAEEGDCLLLCFGTAEDPSFILIDGGPPRIYQRTLRPRLCALREALVRGRDPLPLDLVMVTHIDNDHIAGVLELVDELDTARTEHKPAIVKVRELWHNSFDDLIKTDEVDAAIAHVEALPWADDSPARGFVAGSKQSRTLRDRARALGMKVNEGFEGLVCRPDGAGIAIPCGKELTLTVLGPSRAELDAYQAKWDAELEAAKKSKGRVASTRLDTSEFNLSSIAVLAEKGGKTMLLTGDARGDHVLAGLDAAGKLPANGEPLHVDLLKLPHHGSVRNVTDEFLRRVVADTYVISANGMHDNPDVEMLDMLAAARGDEPYTLVCTFPEAAYTYVEATSKAREKRRAALERIHDWLSRCSAPSPKVVYREEDHWGVSVALGDETMDE